MECEPFSVKNIVLCYIMKFGCVKSVSPLEIVLFLVFFVYLVIPVNTPSFLASLIDTPLGMIVIFAITMFLFCYTNPILGVLYIFVAYELIRRCAKPLLAQNTTPSYNPVHPAPTQQIRDSEIQEMNPVSTSTLEEEIVQKMAPVGHSDQMAYIDSVFKPVSNDIKGAVEV